MTLKVYVMGGSMDILRAKRWVVAVQGMKNAEVTFDWPTAMLLEADEADESPAAARAIMERCFRAVDDATLCWMLVPPLGTHSDGAFAALGYAFAKKKRLLLSGAGINRSPFTHVTAGRFASDELAFREPQGLAQLLTGALS